MSTLNNVELLIVTIVLSLFFLSACIFFIQLIRLVLGIKKIAKKAESFISTAQSAAETLHQFGNASKGSFPFLRIINHIFENNRSSKKKDKN